MSLTSFSVMQTNSSSALINCRETKAREQETARNCGLSGFTQARFGQSSSLPAISDADRSSRYAHTV